MASTLQKQVAQAIRAGMDLVAIEETIIDPASAEEDEKAALWLYAQALRDRPSILRDAASVS
jgi:hypothetical protein